MVSVVVTLVPFVDCMAGCGEAQKAPEADTDRECIGSRIGRDLQGRRMPRIIGLGVRQDLATDNNRNDNSGETSDR
jgi:hypothetical protein